MNYIKRNVHKDHQHYFIFFLFYKINDFIDINTWCEMPYIAYQYISPDKTINIMCVIKQLIQIVKIIHQIGLKHNDIKPQNLIICNRSVKLIDFGLSTIKKQTIKYKGTVGYIPLNKSVVVCCR